MLVNKNNNISDLLSIIIVNYNGENFLYNCLISIEKYGPINYEVIIFDNSSTDNSIEIIEQHFPWVILLKSQTNIGFVGGNNVASKYASGKYLLLLNNDTVIETPLEPVMNIFYNDHQIGAVGCQLVYEDGSQQESIGKELYPLTIALSWSPLSTLFSRYRRTINKKSSKYQLKSYECKWISGAFLMTSSDAWNNVSGLDNDYFMYMEDVDYCKKLRVFGYKIIYTSICTVKHFEGAGRPWIGAKALNNTSKSYLIYCKKHYNKYNLYLFSAVIFCIFTMRSFFHLLAYILKYDKYGLEKSIDFYRSAFIFLKFNIPITHL